MAIKTTQNTGIEISSNPAKGASLKAITGLDRATGDIAGFICSNSALSSFAPSLTLALPDKSSIRLPRA
jgi:hypothetical protein